MPQWEYAKRDLNNAPPRTDDIDLLNDAGKGGWELVTITVNNVAYLKREMEAAAQESPPAAQTPVRTVVRRSRTTPPRPTEE